MADFLKAFTKTMGHEGGYVFDPDDAGGETYRGISRRFNPNWEGWDVIDGQKSSDGIFDERKMRGDAVYAPLFALLSEKVCNFYKEKYWNIFQGDQISVQNIADELFDTSVNMGAHRAITFLQRSLNCLNRNQKIYPDIMVDGSFGGRTINALQAYLRSDSVDLLLKVVNIYQGFHYLDYMMRDPVQEKYARGWLKRVTITKG